MSSQKNIDRFFSPKCIVVIGGSEAESVIYQSRQLGYEGTIYAINPKRSSLCGIPCLRTVEELPEIPDAAFIAIPNTSTIEMVKKLESLGCAGCVCYASGFAEHNDEGKKLQQQLINNAKDMCIVGPNCYGYLNYINKLALWPDVQGGNYCKDGVAIITQSGNIGINLSMQKRGLPIAYLVATGNQAGLKIADYIGYFTTNDNVKAIGIHIESLDNISAFQEAVILAHQNNKPIVCLKSGTSDLGAQALFSHTSAMAGEESHYRALFSDLAIASVDSLEVFIETLKLLYYFPPLNDASLLTISSSGGEASLAADLSSKHQVNMPELTPNAKEKLANVLGDYVIIQNPLDYHTYIWGNFNEQVKCFHAAHSSSQAITCKILDTPWKESWSNHDNDANTTEEKKQSISWEVTIDAFIEATKDNKPSAVISSISDNMPQHIIQKLHNHGIAPLMGLERAIQAIYSSSKAGKEYCHKNINSLIKVISNDGDILDKKVMNEYDGKIVLNALSINTPSSFKVPNDHQTQKVDIKYPLVAKILSSDIHHKSDIGGVITNIESANALENALKTLSEITPDALVEEMIMDIHLEFFMHIKVDPLFGAILSFGLGGTEIEIYKDNIQILLPTTELEVKEKLTQLKCYPLIKGFRGKDGIDIQRLAQNILTMQEKLPELIRNKNICEIEINPFVSTKANTFYALDALVTYHQ